jgi:hypothetical protein
MTFTPQRAVQLFWHGCIIVILLPVMAFACFRIFGYSPDGYSAIGLFLLVAGLVCIPAIVSRFVLLLSIQYALVPGGAFKIRFGTRYESIPVEEVEEILSGNRIPGVLRQNALGWWHSWSGRLMVPGMEKPVDWLATHKDDHLLLVVLRDRLLAISPADAVGFMGAFSSWATHGTIDSVQSISIEPPPLFMDIFDQTVPTLLLGTGLLMATGLGAFLLGIQPSLPADMPFKFSVSGMPIAPGSPIRLIILPVAGGIIWFVNAVIGWVGWRRDDHLMANILWGTGLIVQIVLWFATIGLIVNK